MDNGTVTTAEIAQLADAIGAAHTDDVTSHTLQEHERRRYVRHAVPDMPATLDTSGEQHSVVLRDISAMGGRVFGPLSDVQIGDAVRLTASLGHHGELDVEGYAVRTRAVVDGLELGIQFRSLDVSAMRLVLRFLADLWQEE